MSNTDPAHARLSAPSHSSSILPPPMPQQNGAGTQGTQLDHEGRLSRNETDLAEIKRVVGRPPFLDDPGAGMARGIAEVHGSVMETKRLLKWGIAVVLGAVLASEAVRYTGRVTVLPASAAPVIVQQAPLPAGPTH